MEPGVPDGRKRERVVLETLRYRISGEIMLPPEGYKSRLSDHLNEPDREFLIVLRARLVPFDDHEPEFHLNVLMVRRGRVDIIYPADEVKD